MRTHRQVGSVAIVLAAMSIFPALVGAATVTGFRPDCGAPGDRIVIEGTFGTNPTVTVEGVAATVLRSSATHILARLGQTTPPTANATVSVTDGSGTGAQMGYTVLAAGSPVVLGQSAQTATVGQLVLLYGLRLNGAQVTVDGVAATQVRASRHVVAFRVPVGVSLGAVDVVVTNGLGLTACDVTLTIVAAGGSPTLTDILPAARPPGSPVVAQGSHLGPFGFHRVEWDPPAGPTLVVPGFSNGFDRVRTFVPFAAVSGTTYQVRVGTPAGPSTAVAYTPGTAPAPVITAVAPDTGPVLTPFRVDGTHLLRRGARTNLTVDALPSPILGAFRDRFGNDHLFSFIRPIVPLGLQPVQVEVGAQSSNTVDFDVTP